MIMISAHSNAMSNRYQIFHKRKAVSEGSEKDQERYILTRSLIDYFVYVVCGVTLVMFRQFFLLAATVSNNDDRNWNAFRVDCGQTFAVKQYTQKRRRATVVMLWSSA